MAWIVPHHAVFARLLLVFEYFSQWLIPVFPQPLMFRLRFASPYFVLRPRFNQLLAINPTLTFFFVFLSVSYFVHP